MRWEGRVEGHAVTGVDSHSFDAEPGDVGFLGEPLCALGGYARRVRSRLIDIQELFFGP